MLDHLHLIVWWDTDKQKDLTISTVMHRIKGRSAKRLSDYLILGRQGLNALPDSRGIQASTTHLGGKDLTGRDIQAHPTHLRISTRDTIKIWQPSFYDFNIYSEEKLREKLNYIHWNPVRAGLCAKPEDWPWSSYSFYKTGKQGRIIIQTF